MTCETSYFVDDSVDDGYVQGFNCVFSSLNRIYNQYSSDYNTTRWYHIAPIIGGEMYDAFEQVSSSYDIDSNSGAQLDVIGRVIGVNRSIISNVEHQVFECGDESVECGNDDAQCSVRFVSDDSDLDDQYFRTLLKARVAKNTSYATIDSIIEATKAILSQDQIVRLIDHEDMTFSIETYDGTTEIEKILLTKGIIPTPQGVRLRGFLDGAGIVESGDDSLECGNESAECIGLIEVN